MHTRNYKNSLKKITKLIIRKRIVFVSRSTEKWVIMSEADGSKNISILLWGIN